jgi:hypothetical protein
VSPSFQRQFCRRPPHADANKVMCATLCLCCVPDSTAPELVFHQRAFSFERKDISLSLKACKHHECFPSVENEMLLTDRPLPLQPVGLLAPQVSGWNQFREGSTIVSPPLARDTILLF